MHRPYAVIATVGVILAAVYMLWAFQRAFTGVPRARTRRCATSTCREVAAVVPLLALTLFLGLYPKPVLDRVEPTVTSLIAHVEERPTTGSPSVDDREASASAAGGRGDERAEAQEAGDRLPAHPADAADPDAVGRLARRLARASRWPARRRDRAAAVDRAPGPPVYPVSLVLAFSGVGGRGRAARPPVDEVQDDGPITTIAGMLRLDGFGVFLGGVVVVATLLALLLSATTCDRERLEGPEYLALILLSAPACSR